MCWYCVPAGIVNGSEGLTVAGDPTDLGGAVAATVICAVQTPERLEDLDDLYNERYGRSFLVHVDEGSEWHVNLVLGKPSHFLHRAPLRGFGR